ncbi:hypothetical protein TNCT_163831 [Trichonephila clavata]|uniref:Uncharacterized protein n=1 Tax=Trichonephila clavata TaxID=2740835 RepID=A0A8X6M5L4_TRICU|nr:hypothetical protein TNCT_163831 [Trichonephila clavata]
MNFLLQHYASSLVSYKSNGNSFQANQQLVMSQTVNRDVLAHPELKRDASCCFYRCLQNILSIDASAGTTWRVEMFWQVNKHADDSSMPRFKK